MTTLIVVYGVLVVIFASPLSRLLMRYYNRHPAINYDERDTKRGAIGLRIVGACIIVVGFVPAFIAVSQ